MRVKASSEIKTTLDCSGSCCFVSEQTIFVSVGLYEKKVYVMI